MRGTGGPSPTWVRSAPVPRQIQRTAETRSANEEEGSAPNYQLSLGAAIDAAMENISISKTGK